MLAYSWGGWWVGRINKLVFARIGNMETTFDKEIVLDYHMSMLVVVQCCFILISDFQHQKADLFVVTTCM